VFDELFVRPEVSSVIKEVEISGLVFTPAIIHKKNQHSERVLQMKIDTVLGEGLDTSGLQIVTCRQYNEEFDEKQPSKDRPSNGKYCNRIKYHWQKKGPFKYDRHVFDGAPDIVKSREWFGSGASASRMIIASRRFRETVSKMKWRGVSFEPIELIN